MRLERGTWAVIGWLLLFFGGWAFNAQAQEVPSKDVGKSTYFVPAMPGGSVNVFPYFGNFKYQLPLFETAGVGPCTKIGLTYNTANLWNPNLTALGFGWTTDYFMRIEEVPPAFPGDNPPINFTLPWGEMVRVFPGADGGFQFTRGFGFVAQMVKVEGEEHRFAMRVDGGTAYLFKLIDPTTGMCVIRSIIDPVGNRIDITHNARGFPAQIIDQVAPGSAYPGAGRITTIEYYTDPIFIDLIKTITDPAGNKYELGFTQTPTGNRLTSVQYPPIEISGTLQTPTYKFQYQTSGAGLLTKIIPPRGAAAGDYGYDIQIDDWGRLTKVTDPPELHVTEGGGTSSAATTFEVFYFSENGGPTSLYDFNTPGKFNHTRVKDRRGNSTVYVFNTNPLDPGQFNNLLSEIWDPVALSGAPDLINNVGGVPGVFPVLAHFDGNYNLTKLKDRWGNLTEYTFIQNPPLEWMKNLLLEVKKPGPGGAPTLVESFTYTPDEFANVKTHTTYAVAGGPGRTTIKDYDGFGRVTTIHHPNVTSLPNAPAQTNITTQYVYEPSGRRQLRQEINERGFSKFYQDFDPTHGLARTEIRDGGTGLFETQYDIMGNVIATRLPRGGALNDQPGWEQLIRDTHYRVDRVIDPSGATEMDNEYDLDGNLVKELSAGDASTPAQAVITNYDKRGVVVGGSGPDGSWTQAVDADGNIRQKSSLRTYVTHTRYDAIGRVIEEIRPGVSVYGASGGGGGVDMTTTFQYDVFDGATGRFCDTETRQGTRVTKTFFDARRRKDLVVEPDGLTSSRMTYDNQDRLIATETLYGGVLQSCEVTFRDERDRAYGTRTQAEAYAPGVTPAIFSESIQIINAAGSVVEERTPLWNPATPQAHRKLFQVDARERVETVTDGFGVVVTKNVFGDDDLITEVRVPDPASKTATLVTQETRRHTARKELKEVFNRDGVRVALNEYRVRKGLINRIINAAGVATRTTYYPLTWRVDEIILAEGQVDGLGNSLERRTKSVWTNGLLTETRVWNPAGGGYATPSIHRYFHDQADRLERYECPGGLIAPERTFYTGFSEIDKVIAGGRTTDHSYNSLGQLANTVRTGPFGTETEVRTYGPTGLLTSISNADRSEATQHHTWLGTVDTQTLSVGGVPWGGGGVTLDYSFDEAKALRFLVDRQGGTHEWRYDANGRLTFCGYGPSGQPVRPVSTVTYTPGGLVDTTTLHDVNGVAIAVTTNDYDGMGRRNRQRTVQSSSKAVVADLEWGFNNLDLVTKITFHHLGVESTIGYNARQEVTSESITSNGGGLTPPAYTNQIGNPSWTRESVPSSPEAGATPAQRLAVAARSATYVIDPAGNRTAQTIGVVSTAFTFSAASQLLTETHVSATQTDRMVHVYDEWGNEATRTTDLGNNGSIEKTETYQYNELNRLSVYTNSQSSATWQYEYWPGGDRYSKTNTSVAPLKSELYLPKMGDVIADYEQTGTGPIVLKNTYVQGVSTDTKSLRIAADGTRRHYIGDVVGTVSVTLNDGGTVEQVALKDVFGVELSGSMDQERYSGLAQRERDTESGLDYMRARMYDPRLGRFTQIDPVMTNRPLEGYRYGMGSPVMFTDPMGLAPRWWQRLVRKAEFVANVVVGTVKDIPRAFASGESADSLSGWVQGATGVKTEPIYGNRDAHAGGIGVGKATTKTAISAAIPGGAIGQGALATAEALAEGKSLGEAAFAGVKEATIDKLSGGLAKGLGKAVDVARDLKHAKAAAEHVVDGVRRNADEAAQGAAKIVDEAGDAARRPVRPGDTGTYGDLKARKRANGETEPLDMDHQPSYAAQVAAEEKRLNRKLNPKEAQAVKMNSPAVASPRPIHQGTSPTYGGRNTPDRIAQDAADMGAAQARDRAVFDQAMKDRK